MSSEDTTGLFLSVLDSHKRIVFKIANLYCTTKNDREDLVQEIIFQLWKSFGNYNHTSKYSTWIYRISLNVAISWYRKESRRNLIGQSLNENVFSMKEEDFAETEADHVNQLHVFIKELRETDRALIILYLEENSVQEIAQILDMSPTNVTTKVSRIKQQLKEKFQKIKNQ